MDDKADAEGFAAGAGGEQAEEGEKFDEGGADAVGESEHGGSPGCQVRQEVQRHRPREGLEPTGQSHEQEVRQAGQFTVGSRL